MMLYHVSIVAFMYLTQGNYRLIPIGVILIAACLTVFLTDRINHWDEIKVAHVRLLDLDESTATGASTTARLMTDGNTSVDSWQDY